ncbi:DUF488 domain-containing protein [Flavobacterium antarcticum]|uniref:DUF488 domain-containing protein n=1 Tax=Flavobacterium antarcticum TaxID=271155 RepID=UPI0003B70CFC|nr:DUF488 domain-containing protein [Flavobacterium antarcticum]
MDSLTSSTIYTVGHSTHPIEVFLAMLHSFKIKKLVDVRRLPGSRKFPQYDQDTLRDTLAELGIEYIYIADLGGRRKANKDSKNTTWRNTSFQAYADYMETDEFKNAAASLEEIAVESQTVYMCSEAVWWRCHRSMISDYLKVRGWNVLHIMGVGKSQEHPYTSPARIVNGTVVYTEED